MKKSVLFLSAVLAFAANVHAQDSGESFEEFRKNIHSEFQQFRKSVLDDYAKYLEGAWEEYAAFKGEKRKTEPKPKVAPVAEPEPNMTPMEMPPVKEPARIPMANPKINPLSPIKPVPYVAPVKPVAEYCHFTFCGQDLKAPKMKAVRLNSMENSDIASAWREMDSNKTSDIAAQLKQLADACGLCDWFTLMMVKSYVDAMMPSFSPSDKMLTMQYIMAHLGFDARLGKADNQLVMLMPTKQHVYERTYTKLDDVPFYVFFDDMKKMNIDNGWITTCNLPNDVDKGRLANMIISTSWNMPGTETKEYALSAGGISIKGQIDTSIMPLLDNYAVVDVPICAASNVITPFRQNILDQIKPQIKGMKELEAVNALLSFTQYAFKYATDDDQFGREKYFFFEENFFYPKNDCEDRSIFFSFLVHNLLGLDVHLIGYPGHECTAVHFTDIEPGGTYYTYKGQKYYICDPTYIGACAGMCMPRYKEDAPEIELWY